MSNKKLQPADLFLTNRGADSYTSPYSDFKENILDSHVIQSPTPPNSATYPDLTVGTIWVDTSQVPPKILIWGGTEWEEIKAEIPVVDPDPTDILFNPPVSGSGTQNDPYVMSPVTSYTIGGTVETVETITINNQGPSTTFPIQTLSGGISFSQPAGVTDANGEWLGKLTYTDTIQASGGTTYDAEFKIGVTSVFINWSVIQIANQTPIIGGDGLTGAPNASPRDVDDDTEKLYGTGTGTWADGAGTLRVVDSQLGNTYNTSIVFGVNGAMDASDKAIADGDVLTVAFVEADVNAAPNGDTISGALTNDDGYFQVFSLIKDGTGAAIGFDDLVDQALSTEVESNVVHGSGHNVPVQLDVVTSTLTDVEASIAGGAWSAVFPVTVNPGDTVQVKGTPGAVANTAYTAEFTYGGSTTTWSVTTVDIEATIVQPSITSPVDGASDLTPDITLSSSAYTEGDPLVPPGPHTTSTWEVYEADILDYTITDKITDVTGDVLTLETDAKLASLVAGDSVIMSDANGNAAEYTLVTTGIESVNDTNPNNVELTFPGAVSTNPDLQYFLPGDEVGEGELPTGVTNMTFKLRPGYSDNVYIGAITVNGKMLVKSSAFTNAATQIDVGNAASDANRQVGDEWASGQIGSPNDGVHTAKYQGLGSGSDLTWTLTWDTPVDFAGAEVLIYMSHGTTDLFETDILVDGVDVGDFYFGPYADYTNPHRLLGNPVKVVSTGYPNSNTMVVDGGDWNNGDVVEFGPVTGEGKVASVLGTAVTVSDVSGRWIGANKGGEVFHITGTDRPSGPGAPDTEPPASATYTSVTPSTETLTTATLTASELNTYKAYYSRVKYADDSSTGLLIESEFSPYSEFVTDSVFAPDPGEVWTEEGGVLIGQYGGRYLILGPNSYEPSLLYQQWPAGQPLGGGARNTNTGRTVATTCTITTNEPMFYDVIKNPSGPNKGNFDPTDSLGTGLNGHNDWYVPAQGELEFIGRYLQNNGWNGSSGTIADMPLHPDYKFKLDKYWCSNEDGDSDRAYSYNIGALQYSPLRSQHRMGLENVRVVRSIPA